MLFIVHFATFSFTLRSKFRIHDSRSDVNMARNNFALHLFHFGKINFPIYEKLNGLLAIYVNLEVFCEEKPLRRY